MALEVSIKDIARPGDDALVSFSMQDLIDLPGLDEEPPLEPTPKKFLDEYEMSLDGHCCIGIPKPKTKEEEDFLVRRFLSGLEKLFNSEDSWTFKQALRLSFDTLWEKCYQYSEQSI